MTLQNTRKQPQKSVMIDEIHSNTSQELIEITSDKLKLILKEHIDNIERTKAWQMPLSLLVAIVLVFCSASFKAALGLSADTWCAVFFLSGILCALWLVIVLFKIKKSPTLDDVMSIIKNKA